MVNTTTARTESPKRSLLPTRRTQVAVSRSLFSDQVGLVLLAGSPAQVGGDLPCRPKGDPGDYKQGFHTQSEVMQVLSDFDAAELKSRS